MSLDIFKEMEKEGVEQIIFNYDKSTGLKAITSIHDTTLGPATGGTRMKEYESTDEAVIDAIRLSKGMTYKAAAAGVDFGGGKTVIIGNPKTDKSEAFFRALGRSIEALNGRYYTGTDLGTTGEDFVYASRESDYFVGLPEEYGGSGNTAIPTAYGVYMGIKAAAKATYGEDSLKGLTIAIQGAGKVGGLLLEYLLKEEASVKIANTSREKLDDVKSKYPKIEIVNPEKIYGEECDIFVPCALGGILNDKTIGELKCKIVAGSANNQLEKPEHGDMLHNKGILYAPDFIINAGGLIQVADEIEMDDLNHDRVMVKTESIYGILLNIFKISKEKDISTNIAANKLAQERIEIISKIKRRYIPG